jgi:hypothetical protein
MVPLLECSDVEFGLTFKKFISDEVEVEVVVIVVKVSSSIVEVAWWIVIQVSFCT